MSFLSSLFGQKEKDTLNQGLQKTRTAFLGTLKKAFTTKRTIDQTILDAIEESLITADVGMDTTLAIIERLQNRVAIDKNLSIDNINQMLREELVAMLVNPTDVTFNGFVIPQEKKPYIILVVGVNGAGKTTTIGKLAHNYNNAGYKVIIGAADTFRVAAIEQLVVWGDRVGVPVIKQKHGSDPGAVAFDTVQSAIAKTYDIAIIDTAGRLHNKAHLMDELSKIKRVIQKLLPNAPHEVMLVLDGSTGQNALEQVKHFAATAGVNAITITKLDGTSKGGVVLAISHQFKIPIKFIGVGEQQNDLLVFNKQEFIDSLLQDV